MSPDARRWVECVALVVDHLGQGLTLLAATLDPPTPGDHDTAPEEPTT